MANRSLGQTQAATAPGRLLRAHPGTYRALLRTLQPGDRLWLEPGLYPNGLPIHGLSGTLDAPITIEGPVGSRRAIFVARPMAHTVSILDSAYITVRGLYLDGNQAPVDGVRAEGNARWAHHITIESLVIVNHGAHQQTVGISTKCPAWGWVIRGNQIVGAGTGLYLGDSDGTAPFFDGVIEDNRVVGSIGYCMQIKHQRSRPVLESAPIVDGFTVIRGNRFEKDERGSTGELARPNVLVGHFPLDGPGSRDHYLVYGNVIENNPHEALFQGEGNIALYNNLVVNRRGDAIHIQPHNHLPRAIAVFHNTVVASGLGISLGGGEAGYPRYVGRNAIFAAEPLRGEMGFGDNVNGAFDAAGRSLLAPFGAPEARDFSPRVGMLESEGELPEALKRFPDWNADLLGLRRRGKTVGACQPHPQREPHMPCR